MKDYEMSELTLQGVRQHYVAGKEIRERYKSLINGRLKSNEIYIRSSGYNRTIQSAMAHLYGMFKNDITNPIEFDQNDAKVLPPFTPVPNQDFDFKTALDINYIPYPVCTTDNAKTDLFFIVYAETCNKTATSQKKKLMDAGERIVNLDSFKRPIQEVIETLKLNFTASEKENPNLFTAFMLSDFLISDYNNNPTP